MQGQRGPHKWEVVDTKFKGFVLEKRPRQGDFGNKFLAQKKT